MSLKKILIALVALVALGFVFVWSAQDARSEADVTRGFAVHF